MDFIDGLQIGVGGRPLNFRVLYGELEFKSAVVIFLSFFVYKRVASASNFQPESRRFHKIPETVARSLSVRISLSIIEAIVIISCIERLEFLKSFSNGAIFFAKLFRDL